MSPKKRAAARDQAVAALSPRARKVYDRIMAGYWYPAWDPRTPKAMEELLASGLVVERMRVAVIRKAYVIADGWKAPQFETWTGARD